ncbi:MAG: 2-oxoglutarate dehydrogenase E2 component (dihydrolipoamide succinyltransferase) [Flavobacteriales bacterium]|jgi:2-oxoglutarate dehydrogenase E2 component (dihydrolipoamide succinyltransferase)
MASEIKAPQFPESIADGSVATWHVQPGEAFTRDEPLVDIETDKVVLEVLAAEDGVLLEIVKNEGDTVLDQEVIGRFEPGASVSSPSTQAAVSSEASSASSDSDESRVSPAGRKMIDEEGLDTASISGTGKGGLITKEDVVNHVKNSPAPVASQPEATPVAKPADNSVKGLTQMDVPAGARPEKRVALTRMRAKIAERLLEAKQSTAMLTTFNEVDMSPIMTLRSQYKDMFIKKHNVKLGFMGFFVKAAAEALKRFPIVNASIDGSDVVYHGYQDIGIAVSTEKGLVVPIIRDVDYLSIAEVESTIGDFGKRARDGKLSIEDMQGGTFTITNGGVYGSLMSTPILNPPQAAILGMHKIQERVMVVNGEMVVKPMMYLALSYDHRLIDGKDSVQFLVALKEMLEDPARILLDL